MRILVTGATGSVGQGVVPALLEAGHEIVAVVRPKSVVRLPSHPHCTPVAGDPFDEETLVNALRGCEAVLHLLGGRIAQLRAAGLTYEDVDVKSVEVMVAAMKRIGLRRILLLSAVHSGTRALVQAKIKAERVVMNADLDYTIFRPAAIISPTQRWPRLADPAFAFFRLFPGAIGAFARRLSNISREQLAAAMIYSLAHSSTAGQVLDVSQIKKYAAA